jgi:hypothetical protein
VVGAAAERQEDDAIRAAVDELAADLRPHADDVPAAELGGLALDDEIEAAVDRAVWTPDYGPTG